MGAGGRAAIYVHSQEHRPFRLAGVAQPKIGREKRRDAGERSLQANARRGAACGAAAAVEDSVAARVGVLNMPAKIDAKRVDRS